MNKPVSYTEADYKPHLLPDFHGHPLVEAMNPYPFNLENELDVGPLDRQLRVVPRFDPSELDFPAPVRKLLPARLYRIFLPGPDHRRVFDVCYSLIVDGYRNRNPLQPEGESRLYADGYENPCSGSNDFGRIGVLIGPSGTGKSTSVGRVLMTLGSQVIQHKNYHGQPFHETQLLYHYFKVSENLVPADIYLHAGKLAGQLTGNKFLKQTPGVHRGLTAKREYCHMVLSSSHCGLLVIDNLEYLFRASDEVKDEALSMIQHIREDFKIPILLIGTSEAYGPMVADDSVASRFLDGGYTELSRPLDHTHEYWRDMVKKVWTWKWVRQDSPLTEDIEKQIYKLTQGVTRYLLVLLVQAQILAIERGYEKLDEQSLGAAFERYMKPIHPIVTGLSTKNPAIMRRFESMYADTTRLLPGFVDPAIGAPRADQVRNVIQDLASAKAKFAGKNSGPQEKSA